MAKKNITRKSAKNLRINNNNKIKGNRTSLLKRLKLKHPNKRWIVLLLSIIQIFISLFYLEILEYNFCSLNANTKKNIEERVRSQINEDIDDKDNEIAFKGYDISELMDIKEMDDIVGELD